MKPNDLKKLSRIERFFYSLRRKLAEHSHINREIKKELYEIKYGVPKKEKKPLSYGKLFTLGFSITCLILLFFIMFATIYLRDGQILIAAIGPVVAGTINLISYNNKAKAENTEGGITYEAMLNEFAMNSPVLEEDNKDAQG